LALAIYAGEGVTKDLVEAAKWFRKAAEQGLAGAQRNLGVCYGDGLGVTKDYIEAYKWLSIASAQGDEYARRGKGKLAGEMTPKQIAEGARLAREFKPSSAPKPATYAPSGG
jgi:TPR repeat protein